MPSPVIQGFALLFLLGLTLSIAITDGQTLVIPNNRNLTLAASGAFFSWLLPFPGLLDAMLGLITGGLFAWALRFCHRRLRKIEGLGLGDVKFIAAAGCWTGTIGLAPMLFIASCSALLYCGVCVVHSRPISQAQRLPFGPFLCTGLMLVACCQIILGNSIYHLL